MGHDVFISFSSVNTDIAKKVCNSLEEGGDIRCWIAFRDIVPSANYAEQLVEAIESSNLLLLILSSDSNSSHQVAREIERAGSKGVPILPLRIEDVVLNKSLEYFISSHHWLDAYDSPIENYLPALKAAVKSSVLGKQSGPAETHEAAGSKIAQTNSPHRGVAPRNIIGAGAVAVLLLLVFFVLRPEQSTSLVKSSETSPVPPPAQGLSGGQPTASSQDALIEELAQRFRENKAAPRVDTDGWTSAAPVSIAFLDVSAAGLNPAELDYILNMTGESLRESGRYSIVERQMIDKLLAELNLSTSELADPATSLKLGRILSASLIVTGSVSKQDEQWLANLRFIETETTNIRCSVSAFMKGGDANALVTELNKAITGKLQKEYPLQGKIIAVADGTVSMNIGQQSGVGSGMLFSLLQEDGIALDTARVTETGVQQSDLVLEGQPGIATAGMLLREQTEE